MLVEAARRAAAQIDDPSLPTGDGEAGRFVAGVEHPHLQHAVDPLHRRHLGTGDVQRLIRGGLLPAPTAGERHQERREAVVGQRVRVDLSGGEDQLGGERALHLRTLEGILRPGREGTGGHRALREHARAPQQGERQGVRAAVVDVDQLVLE